MATAGLGYTSMLHAAARGEPPFPAKLEDLRGILNLNIAGVVHAIVLRRSGLTSLRDIAAGQYRLKVDTGPRGTGGELAASRLLALYGADYKRLRDWGGSVTHSSYREALDRMKDGHIEAFVNDDIVGQPLFIDIALARDVAFLPMDPEIVDQMVERYGYTRAVIPAGTYHGQTEDIPSTAQLFVFFAHKNLPDDLAYAMTRLTFENKDDLVAAHRVFSDLVLEEGPRHFPIPLHPGAERYYREVGVLE
jgi:TRAP transporter TAXI family solute receptor